MKLHGEYSISPAHYDDIPDEFMKGEKSILEFGPATGINQLISKHRRFFIDNNRKGNYLGVDLSSYDESYLHIEQGDIRTYDQVQRYDVVIALHVVEHVEIMQWPRVFDMLKSCVAPNGVLFIGAPYKEPEGNEGHCVFGIDEELIHRYLPSAEVLLIRNKYPFAEDGARFAWAFLRYVKRWMALDPVVRPYGRLLVIWRND